MPNYRQLRDQAVTTLPGGWKTFAGQADDPFFLDLRVFDLLYGGDLSEVGQDTLAGYNVNTIALQVPFKDVALNGDATRNPVIGIWSTTERPRVRITGVNAGPGVDRVQVSRLGNPLVNEVVVPANLKDAFNALPPDRDASIAPVVARVKDPEVPRLIQAIYGLPAPATPRNDLTEIFLTGITTKAGGPIKADLNSQLNNTDVISSRFRPSEMLRLNLSIKPTATPNRLGVLGGDLQGFPNGRRLTDDVVDIELQALEGAAQTGKLVDALAKGDAVNANDNPFGATFPYLALPNMGAVNKGAGTGTSAQTNAIAPAAVKAQAPTPSAAVPASSAPAERAPNTAPAALSRPSTTHTVGLTVAGATGGAALAALLLLGGAWFMRRRRPAPATLAPPAPASDPDAPER
jgi:MYXO-CTERM domain-containing protein